MNKGLCHLSFGCVFRPTQSTWTLQEELFNVCHWNCLGNGSWSDWKLALALSWDTLMERMGCWQLTGHCQAAVELQPKSKFFLPKSFTGLDFPVSDVGYCSRKQTKTTHNYKTHNVLPPLTLATKKPKTSQFTLLLSNWDWSNS